MKKKKLWVLHILGIAAMAAVPALVVYVMTNHLGLIDGLDFGAGAYYYADIPEFTRFVNGDAYQSGTPMWVLILLFLAWGGVMYRLWTWLERKTEDEQIKEGMQGAENTKKVLTNEKKFRIVNKTKHSIHTM